MRTRRPSAEPQLSEDAVQRYTDFHFALLGLTAADADKLGETFADVAGRKWYSKALKAVYAAAYDSGRLTRRDNLVVGAAGDQADIETLSQIVNGGAMDVAVAVLVRDLVDPEDYRKVTSWWAKAESAWLPEPDPEPETAAAPQPEPEDVPRQVIPPRAVPDDEATERLIPNGYYAGRPGGPNRPAPSGHPQGTTPALVDDLGTHPILPEAVREPAQVPSMDPRDARRQAMLKIAQDKAAFKARRRWRVMLYNARGTVLMVLAVMCVAGLGDQGGAQAYPPGKLLGHGYGMLLWLVLCVVLVVSGALSYRKAAAAKRETY